MTAPDPAAIRAALDAAEQTAKAAADRMQWWPEAFDGSVQDFLDSHDPAAVLRHITAARQILDSAEAMLRRIPELDHDGDPRNPECPCIYCTGRFSALATLTALAAAWQPAQQETP